MFDPDDPLTEDQNAIILSYADEGYKLWVDEDMEDEELEEILAMLMAQLFGETIH